MELIQLHRGAALSSQGQRAESSSDYTDGRRDGYEIGYEQGLQDARLSSAAWAFAAGAVLMAAILLPLLWPAQ